jgi:hypothetical protein
MKNKRVLPENGGYFYGISVIPGKRKAGHKQPGFIFILPFIALTLLLTVGSVTHLPGAFFTSETTLNWNESYTGANNYGANADGITDVSDTISWRGTTNSDWFTASNWGRGRVPDANSNVIVPITAHKLIINSTGSVCHNITIGSGSSLTITGTDTLTVYGNWTKPEDADFHANSSTVILAGSDNRVIDGWTSFYNLVIKKDDEAAKVSDPGNISPKTSFEVINDLTITRGILELNGSDWDYFIGNDVIIGAAGILVSNNSNPLRVRGDWTNNGGSFDQGTCSVFFDGTGEQTINGTASSQAFYNLYIDKPSGKLNVRGNTCTLTVNDLVMSSGDFTAPPSLIINGAADLTAGTFIAGTSMNIRGSWTNNGTKFIPGSGTVTFDGETQSIGGKNTPLGFNNVVISTSVFAVLIANTNVDGKLNVFDEKAFYVEPGISLTVKEE